MDLVKVRWTANRYPYSELEECYVSQKVADFNKDFLVVLDENDEKENKMISKASTKKAR